MPQAAAHILIPLILVSLFRDYYIKKKNKKKFYLHYVLIAGIAGVLPDLDILIFWVLYFAGFSYNEIHRTFMHTLFIPLIFLLLSLLTLNIKINFKKTKFNLGIIFLMIFIGSFLHLFLDAVLHGTIMPFYPFSHLSIGLNLLGYLPKSLEVIADSTIDGILLILYLIYLELKHKISDFI